MFNTTTGEYSPFVKEEKTTGDVNSNFSIKADQQGLSAGNAGCKENADKWLFSGTILPEKNKAVLTFDPTEEDERERFCVTYIYLDPKGRPHWDMHLDKLVWWRELPNKPE